MTDAWDPGLDSVLLFDDHVVAAAAGLTQRFCPPVKSPSNPILLKTEPWEGEGPYLWGNRLMWDAERGEYRLWYAAFRYADNHYRWGYAVSRDGLHWEKPELNIETFDGQPARNMLAAGPHPHKALRCVARDPRPDCPPERRYKAIRFTYDGEYASFSPDGIHWTEYEGNPVWRIPSDIIHTMWDDRRQTFIAYFKIWELSGHRLTPTGATEPFQAFSPFYQKVNSSTQSDFYGPLVTFKPGGGATIQEGVRFSLVAGDQHIDDGGGGMLRGAWTSKRLICYAESDDFIHWRNEQVVLGVDDRDVPSANLQYMFVFHYGGYYIGIATLHEESGRFAQQFAFSRDGIEWHRPWREDFIHVGPEGAWDSGMVLGPVDPILTDTEMRFLYGGFNIVHHVRGGFDSAIGYATLRRDGFTAWQPTSDSGVLTTQPLRWSANRLLVNADASAGRVTVEVLDPAGQPIPGFDRDHAHSLTTDSVAAEVRWDTDAHPAALVGQTVCLRFHLTGGAQLFAFRFAPAAA